jgi:uncharacterized oxidoreductase
MNLSGNKILITGGGSGIGLGLAERFVREQNTVIICGRREDVLRTAATRTPGLIVRRCDLASESGREELFDWASREHPDVNVLVNNAGIQNRMDIEDANFYARAKEEIEINVHAPLHLTSLFLRQKSLRTIMNVSSGLAFVPLAKTPVYCATKAFVHSLTLSTRALLKEKAIEVIELIPPALNTDLGGKGVHDAAPPVSLFIDAVFDQLKEGKPEVTFGFSTGVSLAGAEVLQAVFARMNGA